MGRYYCAGEWSRTGKQVRVRNKQYLFIRPHLAGATVPGVATVINLTAATTASAGLKVHCALDGIFYTVGIGVAREETDELGIRWDEFRGEWNHMFLPGAYSNDHVVAS